MSSCTLTTALYDAIWFPTTGCLHGTQHLRNTHYMRQHVGLGSQCPGLKFCHPEFLRCDNMFFCVIICYQCFSIFYGSHQPTVPDNRKLTAFLVLLCSYSSGQSWIFVTPQFICCITEIIISLYFTPKMEMSWNNNQCL